MKAFVAAITSCRPALSATTRHRRRMGRMTVLGEMTVPRTTLLELALAVTLLGWSSAVQVAYSESFTITSAVRVDNNKCCSDVTVVSSDGSVEVPGGP